MVTSPLRADHPVRFAYDRSTGGATERFLRGLAACEIVGAVLPDGTVAVPPVDHDPATGRPVVRFVALADTGTVTTWTWVAEPTPDHPLPHPFAFAFVRLDGADTALLHVVDAAKPAAMSSGMRVRADWSEERTGDIRDLRAFVPCDEPLDTADDAAIEATHDAGHGTADTADTADTAVEPSAATDRAARITVGTEWRIDYEFEPGRVLSGFHRALADGRVVGGRCPGCGAGFVPPRPRCPACGGGPLEAVDVEPVGVVESVAVVHLPVAGFDVELPFAWGWIRLDGTDVAFAHLLGGDGARGTTIRPSTRVVAVWAQPDDRRPSWEAIDHFAPVGRSRP